VKKVIVVLVLLVLIGAGVFAWFRFMHVEDVQKAYLRTAAAAALGDEKLFLEGFTPESRPLVAAMLSLARGEDPRKTPRHPFYYLSSETIEGVDMEPDGKKAWLRLRRAGDRDLRGTYDVPLVQNGSTWQIDAFAFTGRQRRQQGSRSAGP
jgi:hypothetical protein